MTDQSQQAGVLSFLQELDRLLGRIVLARENNMLDWRYFMDVLELVDGERQRIRGVPDPGWPDTLWHDYRIALALVQRLIPSVFDSFPRNHRKQL